MLLFDMHWKNLLCFSTPIFLVSNFLTLRAGYAKHGDNLSCFKLAEENEMAKFYFNRLLIWLMFVLYSLYTKRHADVNLYLKKKKD